MSPSMQLTVEEIFLLAFQEKTSPNITLEVAGWGTATSGMLQEFLRHFREQSKLSLTEGTCSETWYAFGPFRLRHLTPDQAFESFNTYVKLHFYAEGLQPFKVDVPFNVNDSVIGTYSIYSCYFPQEQLKHVAGLCMDPPGGPRHIAPRNHENRGAQEPRKVCVTKIWVVFINEYHDVVDRGTLPNWLPWFIPESWVPERRTRICRPVQQVVFQAHKDWSPIMDMTQMDTSCFSAV